MPDHTETMVERDIERCARAICAEEFGAAIEGSPIDSEGFYFTHQGKAKAYARAALTALREPGAPALDAIERATGIGADTARNVIQAYIDHALAEKANG